MDKISIIIPVYNVEKYLEKCIDSIVNQTYKNLEIILIDDGSTDNSGQICDEYAKKDDRIKVIHQKNGGVSCARNKGLSLATGQYIGFVDSDDWIEPQMYEKMLEKLISNNVELVRCSYIKESDNCIFNVEHAFYEESIHCLDNERTDIIELLLNGKLHAFLCVTLIKRENALLVSRFNEKVAMREDLIWIMELLCSIKSFYYFPDELYHYYYNVNGATNSTMYKERNIKNMLIVYEEIKRILFDYKFLTDELEEKLAYSFFYRISNDITSYVSNSKNKEIIRYLSENQTLKVIMKNVNRNDISIVNKIVIRLFNRKKIRGLYYFCLLREYLRKRI